MKKQLKLKWPRRSWSFTQWHTYDSCPLKARYQYVERLKRKPPGPAVERGLRVHKSAELYVLGGAKLVAPELTDWKRRLTELRRKKAKPEEPWAFTTEWAATKYDYSNRDAWVRMQLDVHLQARAHMTVIDYKTGRVYDHHQAQSHIYGLGAMYRYPEVETVDVEMWYIDQKEIRRQEYDRSDIPHMTELWLMRYEEMMDETRFLPQPGGHCRICDYAAKSGGPCRFG